ncbi:DNA-directed RNA polymerases I and III subunit RPAC1 [Lunasporangiospora selenospora]|uniref:DNA-directed RNA polymerases I and III subunit RPAC1 n=1 Tax=Lunasporangiospora selenospora TaxID=979761 RepID=A0A9P6FX92_9FUNG|nr:DNA-directed RNA polymerases I and III subunit RPAC1 [Lunasporangiospora selenospora]
MVPEKKDFKHNDIIALRSRVMVERDRVTSTASTDYPHNYPGVDLAWDLEKFKENFKIKINRMSKTDMEFDMIGVDASVANAFRRILIAEVPTMAISNVFIMNNTSVVADEILAHRFGLVPILADPTKFDFKSKDDTPTDLNTIVFKLKAKCAHNPKASPTETDPLKKYVHSTIYSGDLEWDPKGNQEERFKECPIKPVYDDIVVAKLRPGQEIDVEVHCEKGIGQDHAKWSPVATATYRLLPEILVNGEIIGESAARFQKCFPEGVVDLVVENGVQKAVVVNPRKDTVSREVLRHHEFENKVKLTRVRDHFIFSIESVGAIEPQDLFVQAVQVLFDKCAQVKRSLQASLQSD